MINSALAKIIDLLGFDAGSLEVISFSNDDQYGIWRGYDHQGRYCELCIDVPEGRSWVKILSDDQHPSTRQSDVDDMVDKWRQDKGLSRAAAYRQLATEAIKRRR